MFFVQKVENDCHIMDKMIVLEIYQEEEEVPLTTLEVQ